MIVQRGVASGAPRLYGGTFFRVYFSYLDLQITIGYTLLELTVRWLLGEPRIYYIATSV